MVRILTNKPSEWIFFCEIDRRNIFLYSDKITLLGLHLEEIYFPETLHTIFCFVLHHASPDDSTKCELSNDLTHINYYTTLLCPLQFQVYARDGGSPQNIGSTSVVIQVTRHAVSGPRILGFKQPLYLWVTLTICYSKTLNFVRNPYWPSINR